MACPGWHSQAGACQDVDSVTLAPAPLTQPHSCPRGVEDGGGPGARRQRLGSGAGGPLVPPPPGIPAWLHPPGRPAARTSAQAQTSIHTRALGPLSFCPPLPSPTHVFFSPPLFQICHYSRNKSVGTMCIDEGPLAAPPPTVRVPALFPPAQGWNRCQRSPANKQEEPDKPGTQ